MINVNDQLINFLEEVIITAHCSDNSSHDIHLYETKRSGKSKSSKVGVYSLLAVKEGVQTSQNYPVVTDKGFRHDGLSKAGVGVYVNIKHLLCILVPPFFKVM